MPEPLRQCLADHLDIARLGGVTRAGDRCTPGLLKSLRDTWDERGHATVTQQKLAFVLGWLCHRSADRQMKPVFRAADPDCPRSPTDCSIYHDAFLLREVYGTGADEPYCGVAEVGGVGEFEGLLRSLWQRALVGIHTFIPDQSDPEGWLERLFALRQEFSVDLDRLARALCEPDPDLVRRFIDEPGFYDASDAVIALARGVQCGDDDAVGGLGAALDAAATQSHYAQALRRGLLYIRAAGDYFDGRLADDALAEALDIGKPGG